MKKSKFIKSSFILIVGGFLTKLLGMLSKIVLTRLISLEGVGLYSLIMPTFLLVISISGLGLPTALNVLISSKKYNTKNLMAYSLFIALTLDIIILIFLFFTAHFISNNLLQDPRLYYPIICIGFTLPFITISNIFRSYYFSHERMYPHVISNVLEDAIKLILIVLFIKNFLHSMESTISFIILTNIICELSSILIFLFKFPKFNVTKNDLKPNKRNLKAIFSIALPTTASRLIGSITYFLEPIILTFILLKIGYSNNYILEEYGIINGYTLPIILLPSFFTNAISQALIPSISENYHNNNYKYIKYKIKQALMISLVLGIFFTTIFVLKGDLLLKLLYNTDKGFNYIKLMAPVFLLHYIEHPILSSLQAMNKANINMKISLVNMFIRTVILAILSFLHIGMYGLLISLALNIIFTTFYSMYQLNKILNKNMSSFVK